MKNILRDKAFIYSLLILLVLTFTNINIFVMSNSDFSTTQVSRYSFWRYIRDENIGSILALVSIFIVATGSTYNFFKELHSGIIKEIFVREEYCKYIKRRIIDCAKRCIFLLPLLSIIIYLIGSSLYGKNIPQNSSNPTTIFAIAGINNPNLYIILCTILSFIYSIFIMNVTLVFSRKIKKFYLVLLVTFISLNLYNYILNAFICKLLFDVTNNVFFEQLNIFSGYHPGILYDLLPVFFINIVNMIISGIIVFKYFKDKESLVLDIE